LTNLFPGVVYLKIQVSLAKGKVQTCIPKKVMLCLQVLDEGKLTTPEESWKLPKGGQIKINFNGVTKETPESMLWRRLPSR